MKDISNTATVELADAVTDAFNSNDIDRVMSFLRKTRFSIRLQVLKSMAPALLALTPFAVFVGMFERVESVKWDPIDTRVDGDKAFCQSCRTAHFPSGEVEDFHMVDIHLSTTKLSTRTPITNELTKQLVDLMIGLIV